MGEQIVHRPSGTTLITVQNYSIRNVVTILGWKIADVALREHQPRVFRGVNEIFIKISRLLPRRVTGSFSAKLLYGVSLVVARSAVPTEGLHHLLPRIDQPIGLTPSRRDQRSISCRALVTTHPAAHGDRGRSDRVPAIDRTQRPLAKASLRIEQARPQVANVIMIDDLVAGTVAAALPKLIPARDRLTQRIRYRVALRVHPVRADAATRAERHWHRQIMQHQRLSVVRAEHHVDLIDQIPGQPTGIALLGTAGGSSPAPALTVLVVERGCFDRDQVQRTQLRPAFIPHHT